MSVSIRKMMPGDLVGVLELLREFAEFENLSEYCTATPERLHAALFGGDAHVSGLVADDDESLVAYALFYPSFASFRGERGLYLEDIYITPAHRRGGLGRRILAELARVCIERGCERVDFQVLDWNVNAIDFYRGLGAVSSDGETRFTIRGEPVRRLAGRKA